MVGHICNATCLCITRRKEKGEVIKESNTPKQYHTSNSTSNRTRTGTHINSNPTLTLGTHITNIGTTSTRLWWHGWGGAGGARWRVWRTLTLTFSPPTHHECAKASPDSITHITSARLFVLGPLPTWRLDAHNAGASWAVTRVPCSSRQIGTCHRRSWDGFWFTQDGQVCQSV